MGARDASYVLYMYICFITCIVLYTYLLDYWGQLAAAVRRADSHYSYYERASAASERVHTELRENPEYERPAGRGDALQKLIS